MNEPRTPASYERVSWRGTLPFDPEEGVIGFSLERGDGTVIRVAAHRHDLQQLSQTLAECYDSSRAGTPMTSAPHPSRHAPRCSDCCYFDRYGRCDHPSTAVEATSGAPTMRAADMRAAPQPSDDPQLCGPEGLLFMRRDRGGQALDRSRQDGEFIPDRLVENVVGLSTPASTDVGREQFGVGTCKPIPEPLVDRDLGHL